MRTATDKIVTTEHHVVLSGAERDLLAYPLRCFVARYKDASLYQQNVMVCRDLLSAWDEGDEIPVQGNCTAFGEGVLDGTPMLCDLRHGPEGSHHDPATDADWWRR